MTLYASYFVHHYGCRVKHGRLTSMFIEKHEENLQQYASRPDFHLLDKRRFVEGLESAVNHIHSLGIAHNDMCPVNIMVKDGMPVLIDFGSAGAFGTRLQSLGSVGWYEEEFNTSEAKHDIYSVQKIRDRLDVRTGNGDF